MRSVIVIMLVLVALPLGCSSKRSNSTSASALISRLARVSSQDKGDGAIEAYKKLKEMGVEAFDELVNHAHDKQLAWPCFQEQTTNATTVGNVCFSLIKGALYGATPKVLRVSIFDDVTLEAWWTQRRGRTLVDLRIDACEYVVARIKRDNSTTVEWRKVQLELYERLLAEAKAEKPR